MKQVLKFVIGIFALPILVIAYILDVGEAAMKALKLEDKIRKNRRRGS